MAGRGRKKATNDLNVAWRFGGYGRRSHDDGEDGESYTITNQKKLMESFLSDKEDIIIEDYYIDDGYSGTNFVRPDFRRMMQDIMLGKINGIIVKDLSRLGRNHLEVGRYLEEVFPAYGVRIISINDNIDSYLNPSSIDNIIIPIKNLMNESYARDISRKVSSAYETMAKDGQYVAGTPPYGYMLDPKDKHHLIINDEEAKNVKDVYKMALDGNGRIKICKYLNDNGILCRKEIQRRTKRKLSLEPFEIESRYLWSTSTIGRMLTSETYIGNLQQLKTKRATFGKEKIITKSSEEWIKSENTHEAIISKEDFEKVQLTIRKNEKHKKSACNSSIFRTKLKCADCGKAMTKQEDNRGNRTLSNYFCMNYLCVSRKACTSHKIKTEVLENIVLESIQLQVKLVIQLERSLKKLYFKTNKNNLEEEYNKYIKLSELKISNLKEQKKINYENWKFNNLDKEEFLETSKEYETKINQIIKERELYISTYKENIHKLKKNDYWIGHYKRNRKIKSLNKEIINELIEMIYVHEDGNVTIQFKYQDEFNSLINYLESEGICINDKVAIRNVSQAIC